MMLASAFTHSTHNSPFDQYRDESLLRRGKTIVIQQNYSILKVVYLFLFFGFNHCPVAVRNAVTKEEVTA